MKGKQGRGDIYAAFWPATFGTICYLSAQRTPARSRYFSSSSIGIEAVGQLHRGVSQTSRIQIQNYAAASKEKNNYRRELLEYGIVSVGAKVS